jgi:hypothetical protein
MRSSAGLYADQHRRSIGREEQQLPAGEFSAQHNLAA